MKRLVVMAVVAGVLAGCAAHRLMFAGPIKLKSEAPAGLMLEGPNSRPVECFSGEDAPFSDLKDGQWVIVEGAAAHEGTLVIGLHDCRVLATASEDGANGPGLELRQRGQWPISAQPPKTASATK